MIETLLELPAEPAAAPAPIPASVSSPGPAPPAPSPATDFAFNEPDRGSRGRRPDRDDSRRGSSARVAPSGDPFDFSNGGGGGGGGGRSRYDDDDNSVVPSSNYSKSKTKQSSGTMIAVIAVLAVIAIGGVFLIRAVFPNPKQGDWNWGRTLIAGLTGAIIFGATAIGQYMRQGKTGASGTRAYGNRRRDDDDDDRYRDRDRDRDDDRQRGRYRDRDDDRDDYRPRDRYRR